MTLNLPRSIEVGVNGLRCTICGQVYIPNGDNVDCPFIDDKLHDALREQRLLDKGESPEVVKEKFRRAIQA